MMSGRPHERDSTQGFGRGTTQGRGNGRGFYFQGPLERNESYSQADEWSDPVSEGKRRSDVPIPKPIGLLQHQPHQKTGSSQT